MKTLKGGILVVALILGFAISTMAETMVKGVEKTGGKTTTMASENAGATTSSAAVAGNQTSTVGLSTASMKNEPGMEKTAKAKNMHAKNIKHKKGKKAKPAPTPIATAEPISN